MSITQVISRDHSPESPTEVAGKFPRAFRNLNPQVSRELQVFQIGPPSLQPNVLNQTRLDTDFSRLYVTTAIASQLPIGQTKPRVFPVSVTGAL